MSNVQIEKGFGRRKFSDDSKPKVSRAGNSLTFCIEDACTDEKRKAVALTVDNADVVFAECFDLNAFMTLLDRNSNALHDRDLMHSFMKASVIDSKVVPFTSASKRHLSLLGIDIVGDLEIDSNKIKSLDLPESISNKTLRQNVITAFKKHFSLSKESGCRCVIDQFLLAAAIYAQQIIDTDMNIRDELFAKYFIRKPHVAVFTELPIPKTTVSNNGVSYVFHGFLDYGVGLIKSGDQEALEDGSYKLDIEQALTGVVEAKSLEEMQGAHAQIIMQVLTSLISTKRTYFTGALSNGSMWRFYTAEYDGESGYQVYASNLYGANRHGGLIVELLKDMILYDKSPLMATISESPPEMKRQRTLDVYNL